MVRNSCGQNGERWEERGVDEIREVTGAGQVGPYMRTLSFTSGCVLGTEWEPREEAAAMVQGVEGGQD